MQEIFSDIVGGPVRIVFDFLDAIVGCEVNQLGIRSHAPVLQVCIGYSHGDLDDIPLCLLLPWQPYIQQDLGFRCSKFRLA